MKILGLISSPTDPASRLRIKQYEPWFRKEGETLSSRYYTPLRDADPPAWARALKKLTGISDWRSSDFIKSIGRVPLLFNQTRYDLIWQNRLLQLQHTFYEKRLKKPVIFDFDDAIWLSEGDKQVKKKIQLSQVIFAGNEYLADFARTYHSNIHIIPTTIDCERLFPLTGEQSNFTIGWIGTISNFQYLASIKEVLLNFLLAHKDAKLVIVSSEWPDCLPAQNEQLIFRQWSAATENELVNSFSVGIMPLADTEWTWGKCSYKLLQYLACGKPVIVSPVGMNKKIMSEADMGLSPIDLSGWRAALETMKAEPSMAKTYGQNGRALVTTKYSCEGWTPEIIRLMKKML